MSMKFTLCTEDIQGILLALICNDSSVLQENTDMLRKLLDTFADVNKMCRKGNNYTVTFTVTD